jgi:shikimate kinase/3-dehydroquinate synthase
MKGNIYLTGFMGSGKSTVGRALAKALCRPFVDMDERLERLWGRSISEVFASEGEGAFRESERRLLRQLVKKERLVVATGGGLPAEPSNRECMRRSGTIVFLQADLQTCRERMDDAERAQRPVWRDEAAVEELYRMRLPAYRDCHLAVSVDGKGVSEVVQEILTRLFHEVRISWPHPQGACPVLSTLEAPAALKALVGERRAVLLTDTRVAELVLPRYRPELVEVDLLTIPPGEGSKSLRCAKRIYQQLFNRRIEREDLLIALGGGMVTDLGAFVASTYKRGIPFVLVSTTLLGCVDASVGGKAALNLGKAKNMIGAFTLPEGVVLDVQALGSLPRSRLRDGIVEAYKMGLVVSPPLSRFVEEELRSLLEGDLPLLKQLVEWGVEAKVKVVSRDFREKGLRRILNFGHTLGHAIETWKGFRISHGSAVAWGMMAAVRISEERGLLPRQEARRILSTLQGLAGRPIRLPSVGEAWELMAHDKKSRSGRIVFVLLEGRGRPVVVDDVSREELKSALTGGEGWGASWGVT